MIKLARNKFLQLGVAQYNKGYKKYDVNYKHFYNAKRVFSNKQLQNYKQKKGNNKNTNIKFSLNPKEEDIRDIYFNNKIIEKKYADIKIKDSHNKILFEYLPIEGRTNKVPINFKIIHSFFLFTLSSGVLLIHILPEFGVENYIRDIFTFEVYNCSCFLVLNGGFNSLLQLIQYAIPPNRKHKGLYNSLRFISSLIPLFFGLLSVSLCENFPKDSVFLLILSYSTLLLNYYFLHIKCLVPVWLYKQYKIIISVVMLNLFLMLISEAQLYRGRGISINVDKSEDKLPFS
ncbi:conserved Plasmodium protein, unknown function [Plasmodium berghei]|uniref:Uncharacterized protein n=2 Tax=Plasmodium berghei TaxID=5821 RepID=A0A509AQK0_PLABA|nr:conserved protein, unknown function [Plasmodium berghei ANKA]CXJ19941.1 conserved Plasmodium protein, unknown function [Plasmodium berghei]SCM26515.1 conserved Plasmodium protein, unknown function [Plasmodium berghei]SCN28497.1 conserved Plasmodium protein, unknown function [Plasmodium berghei]SCO62687.1 conserved Plasmodium protein, unknown function [Plasmodium berghei]SCO64248.1 conserved Plasmodium protein, unknown function [Plasmodium berghei]|eukprot:XP_034424143.1 conserved protein, unknown function [Plasmodium berghei ANKA]